jgi:hypothetical protein
LKSFAFQIFALKNLQCTRRRGCVDLRCACGAGTFELVHPPTDSVVSLFRDGGDRTELAEASRLLLA